MAGQTPIVFRAELPGLEAKAVALQRFATNIGNFSEFWQDYFLPAWYRFETIHYETQGRSTGAQWAPLSIAYAKWKQKHWPSLPTGVLSGALRESLTFPGDPNAIADVTPTSLTVGTRVKYAMFQQLGTGRSGSHSGMKSYRNYRYGNSGGMPARPPLRVSRNFVIEVAKLLQEYGHKAAKDGGVA